MELQIIRMTPGTACRRGCDACDHVSRRQLECYHLLRKLRHHDRSRGQESQTLFGWPGPAQLGHRADPGSNNYQTSNTYDALNDLTGVTQGSQTRTYNYDMLARLTLSKTPEINVGGTQCSTTYGYDANGNLISRTAPRENQNTLCATSVTTTYGYDAINRLTSKSYNDTSPQTPRANFFLIRRPPPGPSGRA